MVEGMGLLYFVGVTGMALGMIMMHILTHIEKEKIHGHT